MTTNQEQRLQALEAKEAKARARGAQYRKSRNVRFNVYKKFFEAKASVDEKKALADAVAKATA